MKWRVKSRVNTVSVVVPTHERTSVLQRAIDSVLNQTFTDIEAIVVDDASADCTEEVVNQYDDPRVKYIRHEENRGGAQHEIPVSTQLRENSSHSWTMTTSGDPINWPHNWTLTNVQLQIQESFILVSKMSIWMDRRIR